MTDDPQTTPGAKDKSESKPAAQSKDAGEGQAGETGGPKGPEPTRYGDWEKKGRCIDF